MATVFIIHGSFGSPQENWFPWLSQHLQEAGHTVIAPQFPIGEEQSLDSWLITFEPYWELVNEQTIFVGHSIAPAFICALLERMPLRVRAAFLVSGFLQLLGNDIFDSVNKTFVQYAFAWEQIREHCAAFYAYHGSDDPYVPVEMGEELAQHVGAALVLIPGGGHLNTEAGYVTFPQLLSDIHSALEA